MKNTPSQQLVIINTVKHFITMGKVTNTKAMLLKEVYSFGEIQIKTPNTSFTEIEGTLFMYGNTKYPKYQRQS